MAARLACLLLLSAGLSVTNFRAAQAASRLPALCHVANAGFALHAPEGTVLVDALFRKGLPDYQRASEELNERMETGVPPFGNVRFIIVSHAHADHFDADALIRHVRHNPGTRYLVTPQARDRMIEAGLAEQASDRVRAVYPPENETRKFVHGGIAVTVYRVSHGKGNPAQNIGTLIEAGGVRVFHTGDMEPDADELAAAGIENLVLDAALVPFWVLMSSENRALMVRTFAAKMVIPMHFPVTEQDWMAEYGGRTALQKLIETTVPNAVWMTGQMICRVVTGQVAE